MIYPEFTIGSLAYASRAFVRKRRAARTTVRAFSRAIGSKNAGGASSGERERQSSGRLASEAGLSPATRLVADGREEEPVQEIP
jgi:hypothetical protein